ncbi:hypothetical protein BKA56DRAFT_614569 [Ilyonectria sp. MPI-CAGE-AT-0026]|nr:hypothetical protein BKA56DRAFT_614569 [Ilyonectria sp. MPI-CAGE-AT-0026]
MGAPLYVARCSVCSALESLARPPPESPVTDPASPPNAGPRHHHHCTLCSHCNCNGRPAWVPNAQRSRLLAQNPATERSTRSPLGAWPYGPPQREPVSSGASPPPPHNLIRPPVACTLEPHFLPSIQQSHRPHWLLYATAALSSGKVRYAALHGKVRCLAFPARNSGQNGGMHLVCRVLITGSSKWASIHRPSCDCDFNAPPPNEPVPHPHAALPRK